jgi:hypothetical protein
MPLTRFYLMLLITACFSSAQAQDAVKDMAAINKAYRDANRLSMSITYETYLDKSTSPYERETGTYRKDNGNLYMSQMGTEIMANGKRVTIVNHERKIVMIDKMQPLPALPENIPLDSILSLYKEVKYYVPEGTKGTKAYTFYFKDGKFESIDMWFDESTFLVKKITNRYRYPIEENGADHKVSLVVSFKDISTSQKQPSSIFSGETYVSAINGNYRLTPAYSKYKLINHLTAGKQ